MNKIFFALLLTISTATAQTNKKVTIKVTVKPSKQNDTVVVKLANKTKAIITIKK